VFRYNYRVLILKDISGEGKFLRVIVKRFWYDCFNLRNPLSLCACCFIQLLLFAFLCDPVSAAAGDNIIAEVQKKFESLTTLNAHFEVWYQVSGAPEVKTEVGKIYMDDKGGFRTETEEQLVVCDGETIWMYNVNQQQVIIRHKDEGADDIITPQRLLYEYPDLYQVDETRTDEFNGRPCHVLVMKPIQETDPTRQLLVWVDQENFLTRKFQVEDLADNVTIFEFEAFQLGEPLPEGTFHFSPPGGVEIIDMR
jgi:outer membrane lipoprotein carrier protein